LSSGEEEEIDDPEDIDDPEEDYFIDSINGYVHMDGDLSDGVDDFDGTVDDFDDDDLSSVELITLS
jgi:hypothetical protein